jgi:HlyD family secretion protein
VKKDETVLATLESAELQAAYERAQAAVTERGVAYEAASAAHGEALARSAQNAENRRAVAAARVAMAEADMRLAAANGMRERTQAEARGAAAALAAQEQLQAAGTSNTVALERARAAAAAAEASAASAAREAGAAEVIRSSALLAQVLAEELATTPVDLNWAVRRAFLEVDRARAAQGTARTELTIATRELRWAEQVKAPCNGVVLRLLASPGAETGPTGEGILVLYDPATLRARIDVPLGSLQGIVAGQDVELRSEVTGNLSVRGVVQRIQHESDLLKNTLQVKVELIDAPPLWRPETLCRARFLGAENAARSAPEAAFLVPKEAVRNGHVFVFDPRGSIARAVSITTVREDADGVVVRGALSTTQRVIVTATTDGERVQEESR